MRDYCIMYDLSEIRSDVFPIFLSLMGCRHQLFHLTYCRCYEATSFSFCMQSTAYSQLPLCSPESHAHQYVSQHTLMKQQ